MRICVPTLGGDGLASEVSEHFGRAPVFTLFDTESGEIQTMLNISEHMGGTGTPPEHLSEYQISVVLCRGLGPKAVHMFHDYGIEVYVGAQGTVRETIEMWKSGQLQPANDGNACKSHRH